MISNIVVVLHTKDLFQAPSWEQQFPNLQSYQGNVKEAVEFLKLTSLTATPVQLAKLGLLSPKAAEALKKTAAAQSQSPLGEMSVKC